MSNIGCILGAWSWLLTLNRRYTKISNDPDRKAATVFFGVYSIVISIFMSGLFILCVWGIVATLNAMENSGLGILLLWVFIVFLALCLLLLFAELILGGLMGIVYQFRCNRRTIGYIALVVFILATIGMIIGVIFVSGAIGI